MRNMHKLVGFKKTIDNSPDSTETKGNGNVVWPNLEKRQMPHKRLNVTGGQINDITFTSLAAHLPPHTRQLLPIRFSTKVNAAVSLKPCKNGFIFFQPGSLSKPHNRFLSASGEKFNT